MSHDPAIRPVRGFEETHAVTAVGDVIALSKHVCQDMHPFQKSRTTKQRVLRPGAQSKGYLFVVLNDGEGKQEKRYVHRIVAEAFISNDHGLPQVNHKDRDKKNNNADNLEWCDAAYNNRHRYLTDAPSAPNQRG